MRSTRKLFIILTPGGGAVKTIGMAMRDKRLNKWRGWSDLFIAEPKNKPFGKQYCGLFLELKAEGTKLLKRNGDVVSDHIGEQHELLLMLQEKGYAADFGIGFDNCIKIITEYLN